jgi:glycosyltransferase involved in cell wall biosynthesis
MKVLLVNSFDIGGAANSCFRLHHGLLKEGVETNVLLANKKRNWQNSLVFNTTPKKPSIKNKVKAKVIRLLKEFKLVKEKPVSDKTLFLRTRLAGLELFSFPDSKFDITQTELYKEAAIINLHWVANFLDYKSFFMKNNKPVVWTLHDMNPFTGGEHYTEEFLGIDNSGIPVMREISKEETVVNNKNIALKTQVISKVEDLIVVAPSEWLAEEARKSEVFKDRQVICIPYGINSEIFAPRDKTYSRELLNIPKNKTAILFVAENINNNRKGFIFLKRAFEQLEDPNLVLCAIGEKNKELDSMENVLELGPIYDEKMMSIAYSAADVFVIPSLMDNLPNTVLESLMCGTPVIGFPVGGIPEMIQDGINGFLTDEISVKSLVNTINKFLNISVRFKQADIRENALNKYSQKLQAVRYISLFESILNNRTINIP